MAKRNSASAPWYIYIVRAADNTLYTGITTDIERRIKEHQAQNSKTAKYLRGRAPVKLVFQLQVEDKSAALKLENTIKNLSRKEKEILLKKQ